LASGSEDRTIKLWDTASGAERATLSGHQGGVGSVAFSSDRKTLAAVYGSTGVRYDVSHVAPTLVGRTGWMPGFQWITISQNHITYQASKQGDERLFLRFPDAPMLLYPVARCYTNLRQADSDALLQSWARGDPEVRPERWCRFRYEVEPWLR